MTVHDGVGVVAMADLGKVLLHPLFGAEPQYAVVGTHRLRASPCNSSVLPVWTSRSIDDRRC